MKNKDEKEGNTLCNSLMFAQYRRKNIRGKSTGIQKLRHVLQDQMWKPVETKIHFQTPTHIK